MDRTKIRDMNYTRTKYTFSNLEHSSSKNKKFNTAYYYIGLISIFVLLIFLIPILQMQNSDLWKPFFSFFSLFCHQKFERSLCLNSNYQLGNCDLSSGFIYQFPVCSRDLSFYIAMWVGGFLVLLFKKKNETKIPSMIWLVLFILPMAIDGLSQLFDLRESTNEIRIISGSIAGIIIPFYFIPIVNKLIFAKNMERYNTD